MPGILVGSWYAVFRTGLAGAGGSDTATAAAKLFAFFLAQMRQEITATTTASADAPIVPKAPSVRPTATTTMNGTASDAIPAHRTSVKMAAQAQTSRTQLTKCANDEQMRLEMRQQGLDGGRAPDDLSDNEPEAATAR